MKLLTRSSLTALFIPFAASAASLQTHDIVPEKELLITDVAVVDSPLAAYPGPLSFGHLIVKMSGEKDPSEFIKSWLTCWGQDHKVNSHPIPARKQIREQLIDPWKEKDGFAGQPDAAWTPNFKNAPFRLLAILNRTDLAQIPDDKVVRSTPAYYGAATPDSLAGEGRFVFAALDPKGDPLPGGFTIIFEYRLKGDGASGRADIARWARDWHSLGEFKEFDSAYLAQLASITNRFTSGAFPLGSPHKSRRSTTRNSRFISSSSSSGETDPDPISTTSPIRQIRTSEASFNPVREFREFAITRSGFLKPTTLAATPAVRFEKLRVRTYDNDALNDMLNKNRLAIKDGNFAFPANLTLRSGEDVPLLAARALIPPNGGSTFHWDTRIIRDDHARRNISLNTCNGCHAAETGTDSCFHIHPRAEGQPSVLSKFLQIGNTITVTDPGPRNLKFNLSEMDRRIKLFEALLNPDIAVTEIHKIKAESEPRNSH